MRLPGGARFEVGDWASRCDVPARLLAGYGRVRFSAGLPMSDGVYGLLAGTPWVIAPEALDGAVEGEPA